MAESASDPLLKLKEVRFGLDVAESDGTLDNLGSTYSVDNNVIYDGLSRPGTRIVSFAPILKHGVFPLASILERITKIGDEAFGRPVEVEFAVRLPQRPEETAEFGFLQIRPLVLSREGEELRMEDVKPERLVCQSSPEVLGNRTGARSTRRYRGRLSPLRASAQSGRGPGRGQLQCEAE